MTGSYYCTECFKCSDWVIPARIIHNWDFTKYPVCNRSAAFLIEVQDYPLFDIRKLNPRLYFAIEEMAEMQVFFFLFFFFACGVMCVLTEYCTKIDLKNLSSREEEKNYPTAISSDEITGESSKDNSSPTLPSLLQIPPQN